MRGTSRFLRGAIRAEKVMKRIFPTPQLLQTFRSRPETLIFEGYCDYTKEIALWQEGNGYALVAKVRGTNKCCFSTEDAQFAERVINSVEGETELCGIAPELTCALREKYRFEWETNCILHAWNGQPLPHKVLHETHPISAKYAKIISDGTPYRAATEEVEECIARRPSAAVHIDGQPVSWCLCHLEKSLGMLFTLPEYRRKGLALDVMTALCNEVISRGDTPFAYIITDNTASLALAAKYNLVPVRRADYVKLAKDPSAK